MDNLSQEPSPFSSREGTCNNDTVPSGNLEVNSHSTDAIGKTSESVNSSNEGQGLSIVKVPKGNSVECTDYSITERSI